MKKWFAYGALFLSLYLVFVVMLMPVSFVLSQVSMPKAVKLYGVSGSVWHTKVAQLQYNDVLLDDLDIRLNLTSLFALDPKLSVTFGSAMSKGPEGEMQVSGLLNEIKIFDADILVSAAEIANKLTLPIPMSAHGMVNVKLQEFVIGKPVCNVTQGRVTWKSASVTALEEKVTLGDFAGDLTCEQGALALKIAPENNLGLSFTAYVRQNARISGNGYLTPGSNFPETLKPALSFIGKPDNQGRYRLRM